MAVTKHLKLRYVLRQQTEHLIIRKNYNSQVSKIFTFNIL